MGLIKTYITEQLFALAFIVLTKLNTLKWWVKRNWLLLFYREKCFKITFSDPNVFKYGNVVTTDKEGVLLLHLGRNWYTSISEKYDTTN